MVCITDLLPRVAPPRHPRHCKLQIKLCPSTDPHRSSDMSTSLCTGASPTRKPIAKGSESVHTPGGEDAMAARSSALERAEVSIVALYISRISYIKQMSRCVALAMFGPLLIWDEGGRGYKPPARSPIVPGELVPIYILRVAFIVWTEEFPIPGEIAMPEPPSSTPQPTISIAEKEGGDRVLCKMTASSDKFFSIWGTRCKPMKMTQSPHPLL